MTRKISRNNEKAFCAKTTNSLAKHIRYKGEIMKRTSLCGNEKIHSVTAQRAKEHILGNAETEQICAIFRVLADPTRMKIVLGLLEGDMCVYHLIEVCDGTQSNVSHQLRILKDNGIVKSKRLGKNVEYSIADEHIREIVEMGKAHLLCMKGKK